MALSPKQQRFVEEYLVDLNATQAAIRAGYNAKTARAQASRLLTKVNISDAIFEGRQLTADRLEVTQERVLKEFARLAFLDIRKAFDKDGNLLPIHDIDDDTAAALAGIEVEEMFEGKGGDREKVGTLRKIKLADKKGALDSLAKHLGMFIDRGVIDVNVQKAYVGFPLDDV
jgi:phage terminase small subunit